MTTDMHGSKTMAGNTANGVARGGRRWRIAAWGAAALLLLLPLAAMQLTKEVVWDVADIAVAGALLFGACLTPELVARTMASIEYRAAVGVAVATAPRPRG